MGELHPSGTEFTDPVIVTQLNVEPLGKLSHQWIGDTGWSEPNGKCADFRFFFVLDDRSATEIGQELVTPACTENRATIVNQALGDFPQRCCEGMFPGDRKRSGATDQDGVGVFDVGPSDIRVVDEVDEFKLAPSYSAAIDEAALLLFEGYEFVPDLEEDESELGSRCCHFIL
jgi:hypothetical protein